MADDQPDQEPEPTERLPRTGLRVPVPKRKDVMDALRKVSEPDEDEQPLSRHSYGPGTMRPDSEPEWPERD
jgi:hypothetical protein